MCSKINDKQPVENATSSFLIFSFSQNSCVCQKFYRFVLKTDFQSSSDDISSLNPLMSGGNKNVTHT